MNGAISGAITGGIYGGLAAANSYYERNLLTGGFTKAGKISALNDASVGTAVNNISITNRITGNAETRPVVNSTEMSSADALMIGAGAGTRSNIHFKGGRSLQAMLRTLDHELVHVDDWFSGRLASDYRRTLTLMRRSIGHMVKGHAAQAALHLSEVRAWNLNIGNRQAGAISRQNYYRNEYSKIIMHYTYFSR